jgi:hypothetical protein
MKTATPVVYRRTLRALTNDPSALMSQSIASEGAIQAAYDRIATGQSIAGRTDIQAHEKLRAVSLLRMMFPEMELKPGERALLVDLERMTNCGPARFSLRPVKLFIGRNRDL